jgi:hypothetical protein
MSVYDRASVCLSHLRRGLGNHEASRLAGCSKHLATELTKRRNDWDTKDHDTLIRQAVLTVRKQHRKYGMDRRTRMAPYHWHTAVQQHRNRRLPGGWILPGAPNNG